MREGLVTIVVPVYNVEKYLERCIKSIINQTYKDLEILLIDDKSPDKSPQMCDEWCKRDSRIRVIHKEVNEGLGEARNTGIQNASGEFILFVDSDDFIEKETVETAYKKIKEYSADIVLYGFNLLDEKLACKKIVKAKSEQVYKSEQIRSEFVPGMIGPNPVTGDSIGLWMSVSSALYSIKLIEKSGWKCESERKIISEDFYSLLKLYSNVKTAVTLENSFYNYCQNEASLTHTYREDRYNKIKHFYLACLDLCTELDYSQEIKDRVISPYLNYTIAALKQLVHADIAFKKKWKHTYEIFTDEMLNEVLSRDLGNIFSKAQAILFWTIKKKYYIISYAFIFLKR